MRWVSTISNVMKKELTAVLTFTIFGLIFTDIATAAAGKRETILRLHGSNTIGARLAPNLAEEFLKVLGAASVTRNRIKPNTEVNIEGSFPEEELTRIIEIKAHGSSTGFEDLEKGRCDIVMSSRRIKPSEIKALASLGDMADVTCEHTMALDGVAMIINASNTSISTMDMSTLADVFSGKIDNWSLIGGKDAPIHPHMRDDQSGTYDTFKNIVLNGCNPAPSAKRWDSNEKLSKAVEQDINAIGFCGLPYVHNNKVLKISDGGLSIAPTLLTIGTEDYPITRRLQFYTPAEPENSYTINFIAFALGKGQQFITGEQFVPLTISAAEYAIEMISTVQESKVFNRYINAVGGAKRLSTTYRFTPATHQLDSKAERDLDRLAEFFRQDKTQKIILAGFTDSNGDYWRNYELSCSRAEAVKEKLQTKGIAVHQSLCVGEEVPVASNATKAGRAKNRRVEAWVK